MAKKSDEIVKSMVNMHEEMNDLSQDAINAIDKKAVDVEPQIQLTKKQIAEKEGCLYIEPKLKTSPIGKLPDIQKKQHDYDWEYVKGVYENALIPGEKIEFWHSIYPGDAHCLWEIPANVPCYVPRMIARHLTGEKDPISGSEAMKYHTFDYVERPIPQWKSDQFTHSFAPTGTIYTGRFRQIGAFA